MKKLCLVMVLIFASMYHFSCEENGIVNSKKDINLWSNYTTNYPVLAKSDGAFSYVLVGNNFSADYDEKVTYSKKELSVSLVVSSYSSGTATIQVKSDSTTIIFEKEVTSNMVYADVSEFDALPEDILININNFSGNIEFALGESE